MPNNKRNQRRKAKRPAPLAKKLDELIAINKTRQGAQLLTLPDVPRIVLKRDKVYTFSRTAELGDVVTNPATPTAQVVAPALNNFPNYTEFTNLFEQWRIIQVIVTYTPYPQQQAAAMIYTAIDQDDITAPTGTAEFYQNETRQIFPANQVWERVFTPYPALGAYGGAFTNYAQAPFGLWMDNASSGTFYYGLKILTPQTPSVTTTVGRLVYTAILQFRRPI